MDWIVFGDDWGAHPSTTQHLVRNLPAEDRVIWVDSIGMRSPQLQAADLKRAMHKLGLLLTRDDRPDAPTHTPDRQGFVRIKPLVVPWHRDPRAQQFNGRTLGRTLRSRIEQLGITHKPTLLTANPVVVNYLEHIPHGSVGYLRLDEYAELPGVDADLVGACEPHMYHAADAIFATARQLLPPAPWSAKAHYLPQGVDNAHFAEVPLIPPQDKVLGFFGLIAEWLDFDLVREVARLAPSWRLELLGPVRHVPDDLSQISNLELRQAVSFAELPRAIAHWSAAWIPFEVSELTAGVNPLKIREYLAAGLPTHCTPLPEVQDLADETDVLIGSDAHAVVQWLEKDVFEDNADKRLARRASVAGHSWANRCTHLRQLLQRCQHRSVAS